MDSLELDDYRRYGRQMILDGFGLAGQIKLQQASVAVVGAGGLGCPAIQYLAAAGVGRIAVIDHDLVELSNLHRQILHTEETVGIPKVESAAQAARKINSRVTVDPIMEALTPTNAASLLKPYDLILDCTDNAPTRYLLSDTAVALQKSLVSGAAQKFDGQVCTYNLGNKGPCYRCLFPRPAPLEAAPSCEESGVLGAVTGVIGNLQALEAIKIITDLHDGQPSLLVFSALSMPPFRSIKMRQRKANCVACGTDGFKSDELRQTNYVQFCGGEAPNWELNGLAAGGLGCRIKPEELKDAMDDETRYIQIIDVRPRTEYEICRLPTTTTSAAINIPLRELLADLSKVPRLENEEIDVYFVCRLGNDSQLAAEALRKVWPRGVTKDLIGGLVGWAKSVDPSFPIY